MRALFSSILLDQKHRKLRYRCAIALYLAIVAMGSIPGARVQIATVASGVVLHSVAYATLALLLFTGSRGSPGQKALQAVLTVAAMGAMDEFVQSFLPYRTAALGDWAVDCNAALWTCAALWGFWPRDAMPDPS